METTKQKKKKPIRCSDEIIKIGKIIKKAREKKNYTCAEVGMIAFKNPNMASQISLISKTQLEHKEGINFITAFKFTKQKPELN